VVSLGIALAALVGLAVVVVTSESDGGPASQDSASPDGRRLTALLADDLQRGSDDEISGSEADCIASGIVDEVGVERLVDLGLGGELSRSFGALGLLTQAEAEAMATAFFGCLDDVRFVEVFSTAAQASGELGGEEADCVAQALVDGLGRRRLATLLGILLSGGPQVSLIGLLTPDEQLALTRAGIDCLGPGSLDPG
jgi:hypothetical protein